MKTPSLSVAIGLALLVTACTTAPLRPGSTRLQTELTAINRAAQLPTGGDGGADWVDVAEPLSLDRAVRLAFANNPQVRAALERLDALQAERVQAGLISNPMVSLMALRPEGGGRYQLEYGLMQSLYDLFSRSRRVVMADAEARRREAEVLGQLVTLAQDTRSAVVEAWFADQSLRLEQQLLAVEEQGRMLAQRQGRQGVMPLRDVLAQQSTVASRAHAVRTAEAQLANARAQLAGFLGLSSATTLVLPSDLPSPDLASLDAAELQAWAQQHRPELRAATARVEQARAQRELDVGLLRNTQPTAGIGGMRDGDDMALQGLAVQITLPVFDTGQARAALADARISEAGHQAESIRRLIPLEVERALAIVMATREGVAHAEHHLRQQQQLEILTRRAYQQGVGDRFDYNTAFRNHLMAAQEQLQTRRMFWTSLLGLEGAVGNVLIAKPELR